jgi:phosphatidylinositol alpha-mannosyltransferase
MLLGVVPRDELTSFMAELDIFVMPSLQEGFGIALVEAMAHGKAVIASNVGGMAATVDHGVNGLLVPPADSRALAEAILLLVRDGGLRRRLGEQARRDYEERYAPSVVIEKLLDVYRHALARRAGGCRAVSTPREPDAAWSAGGEMMP